MSVPWDDVYLVFSQACLFRAPQGWQGSMPLSAFASCGFEVGGRESTEARFVAGAGES